MWIYMSSKNKHPLCSSRLCEILPCSLVDLLSCCLEKTVLKGSVFLLIFGFCDIFPSGLLLKWSKKGEKKRKNVIKLHEFEYFYYVTHWKSSEMKIIQKK